MSKWKLAFWICLVLLIVQFFVNPTIFDQSVTMTYMKEGFTDTENDLNTLIELINETGISKGEAELVLKNHELFESIDFEKDTISLERVLLYFKNGKLDKIEKVR